MVMNRRNDAKRRGWLMIELLAAMAILTGALLPLAYSFAGEKKLARAQYYRAIATEIVDGEFELLASAGRTNLPPGTNAYTPSGWAVTNLPDGKFVLAVSSNTLRLEWHPAKAVRGGNVVREAASQ